MLVIIGIIIVFSAVLGGFLLEKGNPWVLLQPAELLIVGGAAVGILLVSNPLDVIHKMLVGVLTVFRRSVHTSEFYLRNLRMLYEVFAFAQRAGVAGLEEDVEDPSRSRIFSSYPDFLADRMTREFVCDSLRILVLGVSTPAELDQLMDLDIDIQRRGKHEPVSALVGIADALPGLGIVAAVLGVVVTMEAIGGSPEMIGQKVAAALVGTFLGILLCYGVVGPLGTHLEHRAEAQSQFLQVLRTGILAFSKGGSPILAVEYARRSIPVEQRPAFLAMEATIKRDARVPAARSQEGEVANSRTA